MTNIYLKDKADKKRFFLKGIFILIALAAIFTVFMTRFALSGSRKDFLNDAPDDNDAYLVAKEFVKPTIKSREVFFPESGYQCAQKPDSVFIIKSYAEAKDQPGPKNVVTFQITLKFTGGKPSDKASWKMIGMDEN